MIIPQDSAPEAPHESWAAGIAVGAYWNTLFAARLTALIVCAVICLGYTTYVWANQ